MSMRTSWGNSYGDWPDDEHEDLLAKNFLIHPGYHASRMGFRKMGIAFDHTQRLVPKNFCDLHKAEPVKYEAEYATN